VPAQSFKPALLGSVYGTLFGLNLASHLPYLAISLASRQAFFDAFELIADRTLWTARCSRSGACVYSRSKTSRLPCDAAFKRTHILSMAE
jgi:hypothetical protein